MPDKLDRQTRFGMPQIQSFMRGKPAENISRHAMTTEQAIDYLATMRGAYFEQLDRLLDQGREFPKPQHVDDLYFHFLDDTPDFEGKQWYFPGLFAILVPLGHSPHEIYGTYLSKEFPPEAAGDEQELLKKDLEDAYRAAIRPH